MRIPYRSFLKFHEYFILFRRAHVFLKLRTGFMVGSITKGALSAGLYCTDFGPVHTNADSKVYRFVLPKTHQLIRVHTTVFIAFPTGHTNTPRIRMAIAPH